MSTLNQLGIKYATDKCFREHPTDPEKNFGHGYLDSYEQFMQPYVGKGITLIEIGVGGEEFPDRGGQSIRLWEHYFQNAHVIGVDLYKKNMVRNFVQASQDDPVAMGALPDADIIIDDASHINPLSIATFKIMWQKVKPGGLYIFEDNHTSYWQDKYLGDADPAYDGSAINFFLNLVHQLQQDTLLEKYRLDYRFKFFHFIRNSVIIGKPSS